MVTATLFCGLGARWNASPDSSDLPEAHIKEPGSTGSHDAGLSELPTDKCVTSEIWLTTAAANKLVCGL